MKKILLLCAALLTLASLASLATAAEIAVPTFSSLKPGQALPLPLRFIAIPKVKHNTVALVDDQGTTVLKVDSSNSAGSVALPFSVDAAATAMLTWRWKVSRILDKADMEEKSVDDLSARVYVFFDVPLASLSFAERTKIRLARLVTGVDVPTAALCYVWDNKHRIGFAHASPYTKSVQKFVLQSGPEKVGQWVTEARDVAADFRLAFGFDPPHITGVAIGNDTDNTAEQVTTWFGDVHFSSKKQEPK